MGQRERRGIAALGGVMVGLGEIDHVVVLMLENRSFDEMLGFLYEDRNNVSLAGQTFDGLTGKETNPTSRGSTVKVSKVKSASGLKYFSPGGDPGEGFRATNMQLFGTETPAINATPTMDGFVVDFEQTLVWEKKKGPSWKPVAGTTARSIMACYPPAMLPVLSGLARGYAVCDQWFSPAPTETMPNRAFALAGTSQGHMDDKAKTFTCPSIFGRLADQGLDWRIYGYDAAPLTRHNFPDTTNAAQAHFGRFTDFQNAAATGGLPPFTFLEPSWGSNGNSQHPNYDVAKGEALILAVYQALRAGPAWNKTLLVITYDEHGGCYDHVAPPTGAAVPDQSVGEFGFDFTRYGVRVPAVLVSPWISAGTVFRAAGSAVIDHTSILKTVEQRWSLPSLTSRDAAAPSLADALTETAPRSDDPLSGVSAPTSAAGSNAQAPPTHIQKIHAELVAHLPTARAHRPTSELLDDLKTSVDYTKFINQQTAAWIDRTTSRSQSSPRPARKRHARTQ
jgi:phospholipase C